MATSRFPGLVIPDVAEDDLSQIVTQRLLEYQDTFFRSTGIDKALGAGDPVRLLVLSQSARESLLRSLINQGYHSNLIAVATGNFLDAWGSNYGRLGQRLEASFAKTTLQFTLGAISVTDLTIPQGTYVTTAVGPKGKIFSSDVDLIIPAGQNLGTVAATCLEAGIVGNGFVPGQIALLMNWNQAFTVSATNTSTSSGGADRETDDAYALRLYFLPEAFSTAGPAGAYYFWAKTSNVAIADASIVGPPTTPAGTVKVYILMQDSTLPSEETLDQVKKYLIEGDESRGFVGLPQTDTIEVLSPTVVNYDVTGIYYIAPTDEAQVEAIQARVTTAVEEFNEWESEIIGRSVNPAYLTQLIMEAGASQLELTAPTPVELGTAFTSNYDKGSQVAHVDDIDLLYGGLKPK
jgi:phage-related baseplate assembly protein